MRTQDDIKNVRIELAATVQLDLERVEDDPVYSSILASAPYPNTNAALEEYIRRYLAREVVLAENPATCGPASFYGTTVTVVEPIKKLQ